MKTPSLSAWCVGYWFISLEKSFPNGVEIELGINVTSAERHKLLAELLLQALGMWNQQPPMEKYAWLGEMDTLWDAR